MLWKAVATEPWGPRLAGLKVAEVFLHELHWSSDCSIEMFSGRCFYFYYAQFMSGRLSSRNSLKSKHLEDIIQLPKYYKQTWSWVFNILVLRWIKEILNDKKNSMGLRCGNTGPESLSTNFNTVGNHGSDIQLRPSMKVSIKAATDLLFPLNKFIISATEDQKL